MRRITIGLTALIGFAALVACAFVVQTEPAEAIPAFARKYQMSCTTCHAPAPRLKDYGDEFAGNGFVLEDQDAPRYFVNTGDEELDLIRDFPIAVRFDGFVKHQSETGKEADMSTPYNLKLLSGGALTKDVAYYFYFYFSEHGEIAGIEDAYLQFNNLFGSELDIYLGQFAVSDPLMKSELRLTYEGYSIYKHRVGNTSANLSYDKGVMLTYGFPTGTDVVLEVVNGNGIGEADASRVFDNDKYKNVVGRISQGLGEYLRVGALGYYGKEAGPEPESYLILQPDSTVASVWTDPGRQTNELWYIGADLTASYKDRLELNLQFLERRDDNPLFAAVKPDEVKTRGGIAELVIMPDGDRSRHYGVLMYNRIDSDYDEADYETITAHVGYLLRRNIRLIAENTYDLVNEENRVVLGFVAAF